jgi:glycosyltransferase involved in cell wall biosynthesis
VPASGSIDAIIPVRDGALYLRAAIDSALRQTLPPRRVIVVDDGSTDGSAEIARRHTVEVLELPPRGPSAALNAGLAQSEAELVAFLDADDLWLPRKLELQGAVLDERPEVEAVYGHLEEFLTPGVEDQPRLAARPGPMPGMTKSTLVIRRTSLDRVGGFDETYSALDFPPWYARAQAAGIVEHVLPDVVARRRIHGENMTLKRREQVRSDYLRMTREAIARRPAVTSR